MLLSYLKTRPDRALQRFALCAITATAIGCGSGGGSDVGYQDEKTPPIASAVALGLGAGDGTPTTYQARANSEITLSGKDSDSVNAPILESEWQQTAGPTVTLIDRAANSVIFNSPNVASATILSFELTVTDANGVVDTDQLNVEVAPVGDADRFLSDPATPDRILYLLAALQGGASTGDSSQSFTLQVNTIAHWQNRLGTMDQTVVQQDTLEGKFDANFNPAVNYNPFDDARNPTLELDIHRLDVDDINQNFQTSDRDRRLEMYNIASAYLEVQIEVVAGSELAFELLATTVSGTQIDGAALDPSDVNARPVAASKAKRVTVKASAITAPADRSAATNGALLQTWNDEFNATLLTNNVLSALGLENSVSANNYLALIDPAGEFTTLKKWLVHAGFENADGSRVDDPSIAHAVYLNNYDLGFGRDMFQRIDADGSVYSYVTNYPTVEATIEGRGDFAVVVMEYSANPDPDGANEKIVKFYAYVPDERTGDYIRTTSMNFDGGGEQFLPGVCTACHQSYQPDRTFTDVAQADLDATFMPWDLDSFLYAHAGDPAQIEPTLDSSKYTSDELQAFSREAQEAELRKLNLGALATYVDNPERHSAAIELIHGWYGDAARALPVDQLPEQDFDGSYVQPGWVGEEELYENVYARNCRICHTQINNEVTNYDTYADFIAASTLIGHVYEQGIMPMARLTTDRFWVDFNGGTSAADSPRSHLEGLGNNVAQAPGSPVPRFSISNSSPTTDDTVALDASSSTFSEAYSWSLAGPTGSSVQLSNGTGLTSAFSPDVAGGDYNVTLTVTGDNGGEVALTQTVTAINRAPVAQCFSADTATFSSAGLLAGIAVTSRIDTAFQGDGGISVDSVIDGNLGTATIDAGGNSVSYQLNNPFVRGVDSISYQLVDADGSLSSSDLTCDVVPTPGYANITIDSSSAGLVPSNVVASVGENSSFEVDIQWDAPSATNVDGYRLFRDEEQLELTAEQASSRSFTDSSLDYATLYSYTVAATLDGNVSQQSVPAEVTTLSLTPLNLVSTSPNSAQVNLSWTAPTGSVSSYNVYRDEIDGASGELLASGILVESYSDSTVGTATTYYYTVTGSDDRPQESVPSNVASTAAKPDAPSSLTATATGTNSISLSWTAVSNADSYSLFRKLSTAASYPGTPEATPSITSYADTTGLSAGTSYDYQVGTTINSEKSITFAQASATTEADAPDAPTTVTTAVTSSAINQVTLNWTAPSGSIDSYIVTRDGTELPTGSSAASFVDTSAPSGSELNYSVIAVAGAKRSTPSATVTRATFPAAPTAPTAAVSSASVVAVSGYSSSCSSTVNYTVTANGAGGTATSTANTSVNLTSLTGNSSYTVTARATCNGLNSAQSAASNSVTTDVSYTDNLASITSANSCASSGCHNNDEQVKVKFENGVTGSMCLAETSGTSANSCRGTTSHPILSPAEVDLVQSWISDGKQP